jgi:hypothetical protein
MTIKKNTDKNIKAHCSCCDKDTSNFYWNSNTGKRNKYCGDCNEQYTSKERKHREFKLVLDIITQMDVKDKL